MFYYHEIVLSVRYHGIQNILFLQKGTLPFLLSFNNLLFFAVTHIVPISIGVNQKRV